MRYSYRLFASLLASAIHLSHANAQDAEPKAQFEPVLNYHTSSIFAQVGGPVGLLKIVTDKGLLGCTAFLISQKYLLTNQHCVSETNVDPKTKKTVTRKIKRLSLKLGYVDSENIGSVTSYSVTLPPAETNEALDYAILEVTGNPSARFGYLAISTQKPVVKMPLWIIGHPRGLPQQISRLHCRSIRLREFFRARLHHTCPAKPGSSGSPVFDASTGDVIAINAALLSGTKPEVGLAVPLFHIAEHSPLLRSIIETP